MPEDSIGCVLVPLGPAPAGTIAERMEAALEPTVRSHVAICEWAGLCPACGGRQMVDGLVCEICKGSGRWEVGQ